MKVLLDTHLLLWAAGEPKLLPAAARKILNAPRTEPVFSSVSLWEIVIKNGLGRADFYVNPRLLRRGLLDNGYLELTIGSDHVMALESLPPIHRDPFDRLLVAQSTVEGIRLLTSDPTVAQYAGSVQKV